MDIIRRAPHLIKRGLDPVDGVLAPSKSNPTDLPVLILNLPRLTVMEHRLPVPPRSSKIVIQIASRDPHCNILQEWLHLTHKDLVMPYNMRCPRSRLRFSLAALHRTGFRIPIIIQWSRTPTSSSRTYTLTTNRRCSHRSPSFHIKAIRRMSHHRRTQRSQVILPISRLTPLRRQHLPIDSQDRVSRIHPHTSVHQLHSIP